MRALILTFVLFTGLLSQLRAEKTRIRVGHFPNVTHAQALVASQLQQQGKGWFQQRLGPDIEIEWFVYNAGPSAMEAIFANSIDLTYVGPNPVLNAYTKSQGEEIRVIAGAAVGGAALVVHGQGGLQNPRDFKGKRIATPQLGNTQDVAARAWVKRNGFRITQLGGDVLVLPAANPDQLSLFQQKQVDAVWTVEPWVSRLELEAGGKILIEQKDALTTVLVSSARFLAEQPELARKFAVAHAELTKWIVENTGEAQELMRAQLKQLTKRDFPAELAARSWARLTFTSEISRAPFDALVTEAQSVGFLKGAADLGRLVQPLK